MTTCFAQSISTTGTPSQEGFAEGISAGVAQMAPATETPSQGVFETTDAQTASGSSTAGRDVTISKVLKEGDALHVLVTNNGTMAVDLTYWKLTLNKGASEYVFPSFTLNPNSMVTLHTHINVNTATDLYGSNFTWNGTRDVELMDQTGMLVSQSTLHAN
jgi:hypothetical protein